MHIKVSNVSEALSLMYTVPGSFEMAKDLRKMRDFVIEARSFKSIHGVVKWGTNGRKIETEEEN